MAGQTDSEFRSVAITETSRNVVCLMLNVVQGVGCPDFDRNPGFSFNYTKRKTKSHLKCIARVHAKLSLRLNNC